MEDFVYEKICNTVQGIQDRGIIVGLKGVQQTPTMFEARFNTTNDK
jgi:hypothetical protein